MSEAALWKDMRRNIGHLGHFSRVESHESSAGIPDVDFCIAGVEGHVELKFGTDTKAPKIRPTQAKWFRDRVKEEGKPWMFTLIGVKCRSVYMLHEGSWVPHLAENPYDFDLWLGSACRVWDGSMDWRELVSILTYGDLKK